MRQVERDQISENVKGLAEWTQARAKTLHMLERYNEKTVCEDKSVAQQKLSPQKVRQRYQTMLVEDYTKPSQKKCGLSLCHKEHSEVKCPTLLAASTDQRWDLVKTK